MNKKFNRFLNIVRGGIGIPIAPNTFLMRGRTHEQGGIDIGESEKNGLEVEGNEIVKVGSKDIKVLSAQPILNGQSPAMLALRGNSFDKVFNAQERFKRVNHLNDDGSKARLGKRKNIVAPSIDDMYNDYVASKVNTIEMTPKEAISFNKDGNNAFMAVTGDKDRFVYPEELQPSTVTAKTPTLKEYNHGQGERFAQNQIAKTNKVANQIYNTIDKTTSYVPGVVGSINWLAHMGSNIAQRNYKDAAKDALFAFGLGKGVKLFGKGAAKLAQNSDVAKNVLTKTANFIDDVTYDRNRFTLKDLYDNYKDLTSFNNWYSRYDAYKPLSKKLIFDTDLMESSMKDRIAQNNTFVRGVRDPILDINDYEVGSPAYIIKQNAIKELNKKLIEEGIEPTAENRMKYSATHFAPDTGNGRSGFRASNENEGVLYTSNSYDVASTYSRSNHGDGPIDGKGAIVRRNYTLGDRKNWWKEGDFGIDYNHKADEYFFDKHHKRVEQAAEDAIFSRKNISILENKITHNTNNKFLADYERVLNIVNGDSDRNNISSNLANVFKRFIDDKDLASIEAVESMLNSYYGRSNYTKNISDKELLKELRGIYENKKKSLIKSFASNQYFNKVIELRKSTPFYFGDAPVTKSISEMAKGAGLSAFTTENLLADDVVQHYNFIGNIGDKPVSFVRWMKPNEYTNTTGSRSHYGERGKNLSFKTKRFGGNLFRLGGRKRFAIGGDESRVEQERNAYLDTQRQSIIDAAVQKALNRTQGVAPVIVDENGNVYNGESCLYTYTDNFGKKYRVASNQAFAANPEKYGWRVNGPIENTKLGDMYQMIDGGIPNHATMITNIDSNNNRLISYSSGGAGTPFPETLYSKEEFDSIKSRQNTSNKNGEIKDIRDVLAQTLSDLRLDRVRSVLEGSYDEYVKNYNKRKEAYHLSDYKRNVTPYKSEQYETYRFIGTPEDNAKWKADWRKQYESRMFGLPIVNSLNIPNVVKRFGGNMKLIDNLPRRGNQQYKYGGRHKGLLGFDEPLPKLATITPQPRTKIKDDFVHGSLYNGTGNRNFWDTIKTNMGPADWLNLGTTAVNTIGNIASYAINNRMLNRLTYPRMPIQLSAEKMKTNFNINPQLDNVRNMINSNISDVAHNTASSRGYMQRAGLLRGNGLDYANQLYGAKENYETQLINQDKSNRQSVAAANLERYNAWDTKRHDFFNTIKDKKSENAITHLIQNPASDMARFADNYQKITKYDNDLLMSTIPYPEAFRLMFNPAMRNGAIDKNAWARLYGRGRIGYNLFE